VATPVNAVLTVVDPDADEAGFAPVSDAVGLYGRFSLGADGRWVYTLDASGQAYKALNDGQEVDDTFGVTTLDGTQAQVVLKVIGQAAASSGGGTGGGSGTSSPLTEQERAILGAMLSEMAQSSAGAGSTYGANTGSDAGLGQMLGRQDTDEDDRGDGEGEDDGLIQAAPVVNDLTEGGRQWRAPSVEPQQSLPSAQQMLSRALSDAGGDTAQVLDQMPQPDIDGEAPPAEPTQGDEAPPPQARAAAAAEVAQAPEASDDSLPEMVLAGASGLAITSRSRIAWDRVPGGKTPTARKTPSLAGRD
jgi:VCBS repeat-containing protein